MEHISKLGGTPRHTTLIAGGPAALDGGTQLPLDVVDTELNAIGYGRAPIRLDSSLTKNQDLELQHPPLSLPDGLGSASTSKDGACTSEACQDVLHDGQSCRFCIASSSTVTRRSAAEVRE